MEIAAKIIFYISAFIIFWAMLGYPISIKLLGKILKSRKLEKDYSLKPTVTVMVVAHNEEKVIVEKLKNLIDLEYPTDRIEFLLSSDNSNDKTNDLVKDFIVETPDHNIRLYEAKERKGKTNAQNEAQKTITTEFIVMTDANSILDQKAVLELMAAFTSDDITYVCGSLFLVNEDASDTSSSEANYWSQDLSIREIEGRIQTITAGNGALYACRNNEYYDFDPIESHDSAMPVYYALADKRAIANHDAIAYEKAGERDEDEFKRKVRMNRIFLRRILPDIRIINVFKYRWFSYFYFGHRTCRYLLWIAHLILFIASAILAACSLFYLVVLTIQIVFYLLALLKRIAGIDNKYINMIYHYLLTILAQWRAVYNTVTGKVRPFWEKAESTR